MPYIIYIPEITNAKNVSKMETNLKKHISTKSDKSVHDSQSVRAELQRKSVHFVVFLVLLAMYPQLDKKTLLITLIPISVLLIVLEIERIRSKTFANFVITNFKSLLRNQELKSSMRKMHLIGCTWACLSFTLITILFSFQLAASCFAMFLVADAMAAIIGKWLGRNCWRKSKKTIEGSVAFFCTGLIIIILFPNVNFKPGAIAVLTATAVEIIEWPIDDNFSVPLAATTSLFLIEKLFV